MTRIAQGNAAELIAAEVKKRFKALEHREIADALNLPADQVKKLSAKLPSDIVRYVSEENTYLIVRTEHDRLTAACLKNIADFHRRHRLEEKGLTNKELMGALGMQQQAAGRAILDHILQKLESEKKLKRVGNTWALIDHIVDTDWDKNPRVTFVEDFLENSGMSVPLMAELTDAAQKQGIEKQQLDEFLKYLVRKGRAYFFEGDYIHAAIVDKCRDKLLRALVDQPDGMTIAQFRDLVSGNRRICLALIGIYDSQGLTRRKGDLRILNEKGKTLIQKYPAN